MFNCVDIIIFQLNILSLQFVIWFSIFLELTGKFVEKVPLKFDRSTERLYSIPDSP